MEHKNSCFVFWWLITLYFNTMYVCFCGALVVNKLFQLYVDVFFLSWYHPGDQRTLLIQGAWAQARKVIPALRSCFFFFPQRDSVQRCHALEFQSQDVSIKAWRKRCAGFVFPCLLLFGNCWRFSFHPAWLSTRKKMQRVVWTMLWLSNPMFCQPQGQKNWSRQYPL